MIALWDLWLNPKDVGVSIYPKLVYRVELENSLRHNLAKFWDRVWETTPEINDYVCVYVCVSSDTQPKFCDLKI